MGQATRHTAYCIVVDGLTNSQLLALDDAQALGETEHPGSRLAVESLDPATGNATAVRSGPAVVRAIVLRHVPEASFHALHLALRVDGQTADTGPLDRVFAAESPAAPFTADAFTYARTADGTVTAALRP